MTGMALRRTSHAVYDTSYHLVWCPKYRKKIFERDEVRQRAEQLIQEISEDYNFEVIEMEIAIEHVHILLSFSPSRSIGEVVRIIRSKSARVLFRELPFLKKLWSREMWEDGYFARTIGDRMTRSVIERYIKNHKHITHGPAQLEIKLR
jgi:putative transposase